MSTSFTLSLDQGNVINKMRISTWRSSHVICHAPDYTVMQIRLDALMLIGSPWPAWEMPDSPADFFFSTTTTAIAIIWFHSHDPTLKLTALSHHHYESSATKFWETLHPTFFKYTCYSSHRHQSCSRIQLTGTKWFCLNLDRLVEIYVWRINYLVVQAVRCAFILFLSVGDHSSIHCSRFSCSTKLSWIFCTPTRL